jgi:hypothetical protein
MKNLAPDGQKTKKIRPSGTRTDRKQKNSDHPAPGQTENKKNPTIRHPDEQKI